MEGMPVKRKIISARENNEQVTYNRQEDSNVNVTLGAILK